MEDCRLYQCLATGSQRNSHLIWFLDFEGFWFIFFFNLENFFHLHYRSEIKNSKGWCTNFLAIIQFFERKITLPKINSKASSYNFYWHLSKLCKQFKIHSADFFQSSYTLWYRVHKLLPIHVYTIIKSKKFEANKIKYGTKKYLSNVKEKIYEISQLFIRSLSRHCTNLQNSMNKNKLFEAYWRV